MAVDARHRSRVGHTEKQAPLQQRGGKRQLREARRLGQRRPLDLPVQENERLIRHNLMRMSLPRYTQPLFSFHASRSEKRRPAK